MPVKGTKGTVKGLVLAQIDLIGKAGTIGFLKANLVSWVLHLPIITAIESVAETVVAVAVKDELSAEL